jgi:hypothetical protein
LRIGHGNDEVSAARLLESHQPCAFAGR